MKPLEYFLLFLIIIIGIGFLALVAILMHKNSTSNYDGNGDDTKMFPPENNYYPYYVPPPKKGMSVKIHVIHFGILREYNSLAQVRAETGISIAKIKECIGTGKEYSNFIFKQLMY